MSEHAAAADQGGGSNRGPDPFAMSPNGSDHVGRDHPGRNQAGNGAVERDPTGRTRMGREAVESEGANRMQRPPTDLGQIDEQLPTPLREPLRYLLGRLQIDQDVPVPRLLAVNSALHSEGVTTISRALASLMANDLDRSVCWVDLSWTRSSPRRQSNMPKHPGITDAIVGSVPLGTAIQTGRDPRLTVLDAGSLDGPNLARFAHSPQLPLIFDQLAQHFDHVVVDMPPILAGSEGLGLMRLVDAYLMVVRYGVTTAQQVKTATDSLSSVPSIGVVMNRFRSKIPQRLSHFFA